MNIGMSLKTMVGLFLIITLFIPGVGDAAEVFPNKPIQAICPWPAGGSTDLFLRACEKFAPKYLNTQLVVINRVGGAGALGLSESGKARPDGYTIVISSNGPFVTQPLLKAGLPYSIDDFDGVIGCTTEGIFISVNTQKTPWKSAKELIEDAKKRPITMSVAIPGVGGLPHVSGVTFLKKIGVTVKEVPFNGAGPAVTACIGGHVDACAALGPDIIPQMEAGILRPMVVVSKKRDATLPDIPSAKEMEVDMDITMWKFLLVPKGTPSIIVRQLHDGFQKIMDDPGFAAIMKKMELPLQYVPGLEIKSRLAKERGFMETTFKELGITQQK